MTAPKRIQRKRTKGWRLPAGAIYVGRPGTWGNPYSIGQTMFSSSGVEAPVRDRAHAVELFREWITQPQLEPRLRATRAELAGHDLVCWCPLDQPCHADVLLEIANQEAEE